VATRLDLHSIHNIQLLREDGTIQIWYFETGVQERTLSQGHARAVQSVDFDERGTVATSNRLIDSNFDSILLVRSVDKIVGYSGPLAEC
jgi:WD40 repeat protein